MKAIKLTLNVAGGENGIIPKGQVEKLDLEIIDNLAIFHYTHNNITRKHAELQVKRGLKSVYKERLQKTYLYYPNMKAEEILKDLMDDLKNQGAIIKSK